MDAPIIAPLVSPASSEALLFDSTTPLRELLSCMRNCNSRPLTSEEQHLVGRLAFEGLASLREIIESECRWIDNPGAEVEGDGWWDTKTSFLCETVEEAELGGKPALPFVAVAVTLLERAGEIIRKEDEPHLVRFVEIDE